MAALHKLQLEREGKSGPEVLVEPGEGSGIGIYVEDCDEDEDRKVVDEVEEWPFGQPLPSRMTSRPMPTAMPPMPTVV